jgi:hypothetical protein
MSGVGRRPAYWQAPADFRQMASHNKKILAEHVFSDGCCANTTSQIPSDRRRMRLSKI